jgi:hypothetical protein
LSLRGGPKRARTADLIDAIDALYQLSYGPLLYGEKKFSKEFIKSELNVIAVLFF